MSKGLLTTVYVDENVSNIEQARTYARRASERREELKSDIWALVLATPKDVVQSGESPIDSLKERFEEYWDELWDSFIDDYKYNAIADDAEYETNSQVQKAWDDEAEEQREYEREQAKRDAFFKKHDGVLNIYNFDDHTLYNRMIDGKVIIPDDLTKEGRDKLVEEVKAQEQEELMRTIERMKNGD